MLSWSIKIKVHKNRACCQEKHYSHRSMDQSTHNHTISFKHTVPEACLIPANRRTFSSGVTLFTVELYVLPIALLFFIPFHEFMYRNMVRELFSHFTRFDYSMKAFRFNLLQHIRKMPSMSLYFNYVVEKEAQ